MSAFTDFLGRVARPSRCSWLTLEQVRAALAPTAAAARFAVPCDEGLAQALVWRGAIGGLGPRWGVEVVNAPAREWRPTATGWRALA